MSNKQSVSNTDAEERHYPRSVPVQDIIWYMENGPIPAGMTVAFRNGNSSDCRIKNLYLMPVIP